MDLLKAIEKLVWAEKDTYYYIDYIPHNPESSAYLELERYYERTYLHTFADKISRIMLQVMWEYPCHVCLGEMDKQLEQYAHILPYTDIRCYTPAQLADIIKTVIIEDFTVLSILLLDGRSLINVQGFFQVVLYEPPENLISFVKLLCQAEGLFLKYKAEDGSRRLI